MPSSFFGANLHSFFFFTKSFYLVNDDFHLCSENRFIQGMSFFYGGSSFEGNSTVWQLHHFRDSSESFDLQSRQLWEQGKRTGSVNTWFSHLSVCNVHSRFFIFFWIKILNSLLLRLIWPSRPRLDWFCQHFGQLCSQGRIEIGKNFQEKNMGRWLEDEQIDITLRSFPGNEYGEMIWRWQIDTILSSFSGKEYGKMMRSSAAKLARMDFQVV